MSYGADIFCAGNIKFKISGPSGNTEKYVPYASSFLKHRFLSFDQTYPVPDGSTIFASIPALNGIYNDCTFAQRWSMFRPPNCSKEHHLFTSLKHHCKREWHVLCQTQSFTGLNSRIGSICPITIVISLTFHLRCQNPSQYNL